MDLGAGKPSCHFPAQAMDPGGSVCWEASLEKLHSGFHEGAEPRSLTVPISTPGHITPDCRGHWHSWVSHSPFCVTPAAVWVLPLGKGRGPGTASLLPRARHQLCCETWCLPHAHSGPSDIFHLCCRPVGNMSGKESLHENGNELL